jgi:putative membrane protein
MNLSIQPSPKNINLIRIVSVAIPVVVALLLCIRQKIDLGEWTRILPHLNALINSATALLLLIGVVAVKKGNISLHQLCMKIAFILGFSFLIGYVLYHLSNESTHFGGEGFIKIIYFFVLISHIILSIGVVPFVLMAVYYALSSQLPQHRKVVKWAFPLWLYVSVTGVIAYLMISPYYQ